MAKGPKLGPAPKPKPDTLFPECVQKTLAGESRTLGPPMRDAPIPRRGPERGPKGFHGRLGLPAPRTEGWQLTQAAKAARIPDLCPRKTIIVNQEDPMSYP